MAMAERDILPGNFQPRHYTLAITDLDFANWTYKGTVSIEGELTTAVDSIVLNALEVDIASAELELKTGEAEAKQTASSINYDKEKQRATLGFAGPEKGLNGPGGAVLSLAFSGLLNHDLAGFYRSQYKPVDGAAEAAPSTPRDADFCYMLSTQFEACDARRAFPCFDEPNRKATFDFSIEIPADLVALSNMPVKEETKLDKAGKHSLKRVTFERTPIMSTYLLAWAVGDLEYLEAFTERLYPVKKGGKGEVVQERLPVRIYTVRGLKERGRWALEHAPRYIDFFSEQFGLDYPLPKADILAVDEFTHGAMENWGLVTYRASVVLFDEQRSDGQFRNRIAYIIAHELAHQWFGDLVTMDWWDELWLNEGFATWAGWLATAWLHPDWDVWPQFVNEGMERALKLDALRSSHPIQVPVSDALDVNQVFDAISYLKGCSVIRMLAAHLGTDVFLKGVAAYLRRHQYGNATTAALWTVLAEVSGRDVHALMTPWITKVGFPLLTVEETADGDLAVQQSRFLGGGEKAQKEQKEGEEDEDATIWWIPLALAQSDGTAAPTAAAATPFTTKQTLLSGVAASPFYLLNSGATGFFRVSYPPARLATLGRQLPLLSVEDKISLVGSTAELAFAGKATTPTLLDFLQGFAAEADTAIHMRVLCQVLDTCGAIQRIFDQDESDDIVAAGLRAFVLRLIAAPLKRLGWTGAPDEDYQESQLRKRLLSAAVRNGEKDIIAEAVSRFHAYTADPAAHPLPADLRSPIFMAAVATEPASAIPRLMHEWRSSAVPDAKQVTLAALGTATADAALVQHTLLPFMLGTSSADSVAAGDVHFLAGGLSTNRTARRLLWQYLQQEWDGEDGLVYRKLAGNPVMLDRFVAVSLDDFADLATLHDIDAFFATRDTRAFDRTLATVKDTIRGQAAYRERDAAPLRAWLLEHGYAKAE